LSYFDQPNPSGLSDNSAGGLASLTIIPAIVFLAVAPFKSSSSVRFSCMAVDLLDCLGGGRYSCWSGATPRSIIGLSNLDGAAITVLQLIGLAYFAVLLSVLDSASNGKRIMQPIIGCLAERQANE
jgi:uncharacterized membrane protein